MDFHFQRNGRKVFIHSFLYVTLMVLATAFFRDFQIQRGYLFLLFFVPMVALLLYIKWNNILTLLYHVLFVLTQALLATYILNGFDVYFEFVTYLVVLFVLYLLLIIAYLVFRTGITRKGVYMAIYILLITPILFMFLTWLVFSYLHFWDIVKATFFLFLSFGILPYFYVFAIGLSFKQRWRYQSCLNAPFFVPFLVLYNVFIPYISHKNRILVKQFIQEDLSSKRID